MIACMHATNVQQLPEGPLPKFASERLHETGVPQANCTDPACISAGMTGTKTTVGQETFCEVQASVLSLQRDAWGQTCDAALQEVAQQLRLGLHDVSLG